MIDMYQYWLRVLSSCNFSPLWTQGRSEVMWLPHKLTLIFVGMAEPDERCNFSWGLQYIEVGMEKFSAGEAGGRSVKVCEDWTE